MQIPNTVQGEHARHLYERVNELRAAIKEVAEDANSLRKVAGAGELAPQVERGEVIANVTLGFRCLEDASMRFGKALQALDGGASVYDKGTTVGAPPERDLAGTLFEFAGWLTTLEQPLTVGQTHDAAPMADLVGQFLLDRSIPQPGPEWEKSKGTRS